jgi:tetratricopeptide (TPR) repeat protein
LLTDLGLYAAARSMYREAATLATVDIDTISSYPLLQAWAGLALIHYLDGEPDAARTYGEKLLAALDTGAGFQGLDPLMRARAWLAIGHACLRVGDLGAAQAAYQSAFGLVKDAKVHVIQRPNLVLDVREGLAAVAMAREEPAKALDYIAPIVDQLLAGRIDGALEPIRVYVTSYRVLEAAGDARADEVLEAGYGVLQRRVTTIADEATRESYLGNVEANREILSLYARGRSPGWST